MFMRVLGPVKHHGQTVPVGAVIELADREGARLVRGGYGMEVAADVAAATTVKPAKPSKASK